MMPTQAMMIGESEPIRRLRRMITAVAPARLPVVIEGETGTGKELVAAMLHRESGRDGSLIAFNVCAVGETMFEDALFGHARGAFTGAVGETLGFLREANGGSAFFDEIGGLAAPMQAKLLRALESGVFRPIGASRDAQSDFRTIAATNERVVDLVAAGRLRADLAHRLSGIVLSVPALAERVDDIPILAEYFAARARQNRPVSVTRRANRLLQERTWSGNVRELKQVVDAAMVFASDVLDIDSLDVALAHRSSGGSPVRADVIPGERRLFEQVLERAGWDTERVAAGLGVHRATVYRRIKRLGIEIPRALRFREFIDPSFPIVSRELAVVGSNARNGMSSRSEITSP
ncbi:MAG: acetoacetate metabolism regulatory protein AtoC [Gemmatimonadetes bacterium]|nr:acetoacetate metabolism regulatory protein AtoC [Gemmatimonadota bacterium]